MDLTQLEPNTMIEGDAWEGPAMLKYVLSDQNLLIIQHNGETKTFPITHDIRPADVSQGVSWRAFVAAEQLRHECARNLGEFGSADQLPHQLKTIYQVSGEPGRIRYMIADEPGGGKTVIASRIIQELLIQKQIQRVLIVVPPMLRYQWQDELKRFVNLDSKVIGGNTRGNPWRSGDILITSMDYAKQKNRKELLIQAKFDMIVVDEAHKLNAARKDKTDLYKLGEEFDTITEHMLFLTATPHRGKSDNFQLLLRLLQPELISSKKMEEEDVANIKDKFFIRHTKEEMVSMEGRKLFLERNVKSVTYEMSPTERDLYDKVTDYVGRQYNKQMGFSSNRIVTFAILIIQRRMASSIQALIVSLERRRKNLGQKEDVHEEEVDDMDDMDDEEKEKAEEKAAGYTSAQTPEEIEAERKELDGLIGLAKHAANTKPDTKLQKLLEEIKGIGNDKLLIFSEYTDTLNYLQDKLSGVSLCRIDGSMSMEDRAKSQEEFRHTAQVMLATDAAREGINLQFCHRMINYDLPWTPISLEQRMGRLHRYGQEHEVVISNMIAPETREGHVMDTLFKKIEMIKKQYDTFDVLGKVLSGGNLRGLMTDAIRSGSDTKMEDELEKAAEEAEKVEKMFGSSIPLNLDDIKRRVKEVEEQHTDGKYLVQMMNELFKGLGGSIMQKENYTKLEVPPELRSGQFTKKDHRYNTSPSELFARGSDVYRHLEEWIKQNCSNDLKSGSVFRDPEGFDGYVIFHTIPIQDKREKRVSRLLVAHKYADGEVYNVQPYILHDMTYDDNTEAGKLPPMEDIQKAANDMGDAERAKIVAEREELWKYRKESVMRRIKAETARLSDEMIKVGFGKDRDKLTNKINELKQQGNDIDTEYNRAMNLTCMPPVLEGWVRVIPDLEGPRYGRNTEEIGMRASMAHERAEGFVVTDVSRKRNIGYDLLSKHSDGRVRKIEVKARCDTSPIQLTDSELNNLQSDKDARLYVIYNAGEPDQELQVVSNTSDIKTTLRTVHEVTPAEIRRIKD